MVTDQEKRKQDDESPEQKKNKLIVDFLKKKQKLTSDGDSMHQKVQDYNADVRAANQVWFEYTRLLSYGEKPRIWEEKPYFLTKNMSSKRQRK